MIVNNIEMRYICAGRGHDDMYWELPNYSGGGRERVRESNRRDWTEQGKVYSQLGYIKKPLWTPTLKLKMKGL
jgi:hypothetical protein